MFAQKLVMFFPSLTDLFMHIRTSFTFLKCSSNLSNTGVALPIQCCTILCQFIFISCSFWLISQQGGTQWEKTMAENPNSGAQGVPLIYVICSSVSITSFPSPVLILKGTRRTLCTSGNRYDKMEISQSLPTLATWPLRYRFYITSNLSLRFQEW